MDYFDDNAFDLPLDIFIDDVASWIDHSHILYSSSLEISQTSNMIGGQEYEGKHTRRSSCFEIDFSQTSSVFQDQEYEIECPKKRGRTTVCSKPKTKAFREKERREKLNDSFVNLSTVLEPGQAAKTDKLTILADAIRVVKQLRNKNEECKEENKKLQAEIESLKAEKNELRIEKSTLKAEKESLEQQMKTMSITGSALVPPYAPAYQAGPNKMAVYPSYGMYPMWHYLPSSIIDSSRDHELRPPAA